MLRIHPRALVLTGLWLACPSALTAQSVSFHLGGGPVLPQASFDDSYKLGWQGMAGGSFSVANSPFVIRIDGFYGQNVGDQAKVGNDVKAKLLGGLVGAQYNLGRADTHVYLLGQLGLTNGKIQIASLEDSETKFTFAGGAGLAFAVGSLHLFAEAKYMQVQRSDIVLKMIPIILGVQFGGM